MRYDIIITDGCVDDIKGEFFLGPVKEVNHTTYYAKDSIGTIMPGKRFNFNFFGSNNFQLVFDRSGKITERKRIHEDGSLTVEYQFFYDSDKNLIKVISPKYKSSHDNETWNTINYDSKGNISESIIHKNTSDIINMYNFRRDSLLEIKQYKKDIKNSFSDLYYLGKHVFKYDEKGNLITEEEYDARDSFIRKYLFKYDLDGNMIQENRIDDDHNYDYESNYWYDDYGNVVEEKTYDKNCNLESFCRYKYKYDDFGNWIECVFYKDGIPEFIDYRTFAYFDYN